MATRQRPLSPHLQVYRWQIQMATSILHRATGVFLSVGALIIAAGLLALVLQTAVKFVAVLGMIVSVFAVGRIALGVA